MATVRILQWRPRVMPLQRRISFFFQEKWAVLAPYILKRVAIAQAVETARSRAGLVTVQDCEQHIAFVRMWVRNSHSSKIWCFDVWHVVHFRGIWTVVPDLMNTKHLVLVALDKPLYLGDPTKFHSYLKIDKVW